MQDYARFFVWVFLAFVYKNMKKPLDKSGKWVYSKRVI